MEWTRYGGRRQCESKTETEDVRRMKTEKISKMTGVIEWTASKYRKQGICNKKQGKHHRGRRNRQLREGRGGE